VEGGLPMKLLFGMLLMIGGLCGAIMSFCGTIVVSSSLALIDGVELSLYIALFSIVVFLSGLSTLFSSS
jgi:hypothetical protein